MPGFTLQFVEGQVPEFGIGINAEAVVDVVVGGSLCAGTFVDGDEYEGREDDD